MEQDASREWKLLAGLAAALAGLLAYSATGPWPRYDELSIALLLGTGLYWAVAAEAMRRFLGAALTDPRRGEKVRWGYAVLNEGTIIGGVLLIVIVGIAQQGEWGRSDWVVVAIGVFLVFVSPFAVRYRWYRFQVRDREIDVSEAWSATLPYWGAFFAALFSALFLLRVLAQVGGTVRLGAITVAVVLALCEVQLCRRLVYGTPELKPAPHQDHDSWRD